MFRWIKEVVEILCWIVFVMPGMELEERRIRKKYYEDQEK